MRLDGRAGTSYFFPVSYLYAGLLGILLATLQVEAASTNPTPSSVSSKQSSTNAADAELEKILLADNQAREEVDKWIRDAHQFEEKGVGTPQTTLKARIEKHLEPVKKDYEEFLKRNPKHVDGLIAFGSFLSETGDEVGAKEQWDKALELDKTKPALYNNLANWYGHNSPVKKAFEFYGKAIALDTNQPVYYQNFATTVYLFRPDAMEYYNISETEVFDKALDLYRKALALAPTDFVLATDYSQSFYGTKPPRYAEGLKAWEDTIKLARDDIEREGVLIHIARCKINLGKIKEARADLNSITNQMYLDVKDRLIRKIEKDSAKDTAKTPPAANE